MESMIEKLSAAGVIPVVKIEKAGDAVPLAKALREGGLNCAEITFRTDAAEQAIREIHKAFPDMLLIAGTVLNREQADRAMAAGASGIVSPGLNRSVAEHCIQKNYPIIPGIATPTELDEAMSLGLTYLKFFPAEAAGGVRMIRAMSAPYPMVHFMPTGGISSANLADYLGCKAVFACGGSWMVPADKLAAGKFEEIRALAGEAVSLLQKIRS